MSHRQTRDLAEAHRGPHATWFPDAGDHAQIREADPAEYERRIAAFLDGLRPLGRAVAQ